MLRYPGASAPKATVTVKDPLFAKALSDRLKTEGTDMSAVVLPTGLRQTNCRKVHVSWHRATRNVWLSFRAEDIARRVAQRFNEGRYKCLGSSVKASTPTKRIISKENFSYDRAPWSITLNSVPGDATSEDVEEAIHSFYDTPRRIEMGPVNYLISEADVSVAVRRYLERHGPLESFYLDPSSTGKRAKVTAWFQHEVDAISACRIDEGKSADLGNGKITATLIQSAKVKVSTKVYEALESTIKERTNAWRRENLTLRAYKDDLQRFTTLKIEGLDAKYVTKVRRTLHEILSGVVLSCGGNALWSPVFGSNGSAYERLLSIEKDLNVVISREKAKQQLKFYGEAQKIETVVCRINEIIKGTSSGYEIDLDPTLFSRAMRGGFKRIEAILGKNVAVFNVVSKKITINGTAEQHNTALAVIDSEDSIASYPIRAIHSGTSGDCPICLCEAEVPVEMSCKHAYCLQCLGEHCEKAALSSSEEFQVKCYGAEGTCPTVFTLKELQSYLPSFAFESALKNSFQEYVKRRPDSFRSCPTPDCGHIYRCTEFGGLKKPEYICPNCFEPLCTSCHAQHGDYTCAEYKDIVSGGIEALEKLKKELNIKDCPRCKIPMEKTTGCNHMMCAACKVHICWVCMAVFANSEPCYAHLTEQHGGWGLDHED